MIVVYHAGAQLMKVRAMMLVSLVCAAATVWWGWDLAQTYGSRPADGGELAPLAVRMAWGVGVGSLGVVFACGMWLYGRLYVAKMELEEGTDRLRIHTVRFIGTRKRMFDASGVSASRHHEGRTDLPDAPSVNAPWTNLRLSGRRLPLILDQQGVFPRADLAEELLGSSSRSPL